MIEGQLDGSVDGRLDAVVDGRVLGWAWSQHDPADRTHVVVCIDGRPVASGIADQPRPSLVEAGIGDGIHAFSVQLPGSVADGQEHTVQVLAGPGRTPLRAALGFSASSGDASFFVGTSFVPGKVSPPAMAPERRIGATAGLWAAVRPSARTAPWWLIGGGCFAYLVIFLYLTRHFGFFGDEWAFILKRRPWTAASLLNAYNQHLELIPIVIYKLLFVTVGLGTTWPYRLIVFTMHFLCVIGIYVLARRRTGAWIALVPAGLLLVLGAGFEDELWPVNISFLGGMAAGLWALICIDRGDRRGDLLAALLILVSLASASIALPFAVAVGIELLVLRSPRRLWIVLVPLALYGVWYGHYGASDVVWANVPHVPGYVVKIGAYGFAGLIGLSSITIGVGGVTLVVGVIMLACAVAFLVWQMAHHWPLPPRAITGVVAAIAFWIATALARAQFNQPDASRYVYPSVAFVLVAAIAFLRWRRVTVRMAQVMALAGGAIAVLGLLALRDWANQRTAVDGRTSVALAAAEIAGGAGKPAYVPSPGLPFMTLRAYLDAVHALGSPALPRSQLATQPLALRKLADATIIGAEGIAPSLAARPPGSDGPCSQLNAGPLPERVDVTVAPGRPVYVTAAGTVTLSIWLRRASPAFPITPTAVVQPGTTVRMNLPRDSWTSPWRLRVGLPPGAAESTPTRLATVCLGTPQASA